MSNKGFKRISISVSGLSRSDINTVLKAISDVFIIESVKIHFNHGPVSSFKDIHLSSNQFNSDPDHIHPLFNNGGAADST